MKILVVAGEMTPYAKTGGLGDVVGALSSALRERGHEVTCCLPFYRGAREAARNANDPNSLVNRAARLLVPVVKGELLATDGHGLFLVQQLTAQWGYLRDAAGTTVWFHLAPAPPGRGELGR